LNIYSSPKNHFSYLQSLIIVYLTFIQKIFYLRNNDIRNNYNLESYFLVEMKTSVVVITRNAEFYIKDLLDSLVTQVKKPHEVIVTDADSTDSTQKIVKEYSKNFSFIKLYVKSGTRAEGRNFGVSKATGDIVTFIDADAIANAFWIQEIEKSMNNADIVAGKEVRFGLEGFGTLPRVEMIHHGTDITYPSVNLAYKKDVFEEISGFDPWFKEAEEVDLNYRAVDAGYKLIFDEDAIVYHRARSTLFGFIKQSFWYGFGRKELTLRHGNLWSSYSPIDMVKINPGESIWKILRLSIAFFGYIFCKIVGKKTDTKERLRKSTASER
jgi:glycosyltransferase involved in cell wall biosynthesis